MQNHETMLGQISSFRSAFPFTNEGQEAGEEMTKVTTLHYDRVKSQASRHLEFLAPCSCRLLDRIPFIHFVYPVDPGETSSERLPCLIGVQLDIPGPLPDNCWGRT